ncbi:phosphopantetheine-binding protein [Streptomyces buecherae]|uniref:acyl carrier protein n=1 Tax=Streptomyces buecherae TaxID=2763006 RepID=UPI0033F33B35
MTRNDILAGIAGVLYETVAVDPAQISEESSLATDLEVDSLLVTEVAVALEAHFSVIIAQAELDEARLVGDLVDLVEKGLVA